MKTRQILAVLGFSAIAMAQSLAPSPTESAGCEPHGDHWHCEGPRETGAGADSATAAVTTTASEDSETFSNVTLPPSPTGRGECSVHVDHWHCDIPATAVSTSSDVAATTTAAEDSEVSSSATLPPSPTGRGECSVHVDHWHCDIPATATASESTAAFVSTDAAGATTAAASGADNSTSSAITVLAGAARAGLGAAAVAAALVAF